MRVNGEEMRRVRDALGESQTVFGLRFGVTRRTVIRWEQAGTVFSEWRRYGAAQSEARTYRHAVEQAARLLDLWLEPEERYGLSGETV